MPLTKNLTPRRLGVKKGDTVIVLRGKDRGSVGEILTAFPKSGKVTVSGVNMISRHQRPPQGNPFGAIQQGIIKKEAPLDSSKVMLQCPVCHKGTRVQRVLGADGRRTRVCKKCGKNID